MNSKNFLYCLLTTFMLYGVLCFPQINTENNLCPIDADIWVLAGQSNMDGNGRTPDTLTNSNIIMMGLDNKWVTAQNPLHRIFEAAAPAYELTIKEFPWYKEMNNERVTEELTKKREESKKHPVGGVGPGIYFAKEILKQTGRPVALIPCAIGGTSMAQWSPDKKPGGDSSLYGAMINRIKSAGRNIKGFIWFQGEGEAMSGNTKTYEKDLLYLIDRFRKDTGYPDLPVVIIQIGCFNIHNPAMDKGYEEIREIQRKVIKERKNLFMVSSSDLPLDDWAHISTEGHRRLGKRIAAITLNYVYNMKDQAEQIDLQTIKMCQDDITGSNYLQVHFSGIKGSLICCGRPALFEIRVNGETRYDYVVAKVELDPSDPSGLKLFLSGVPVEPAQLVFGPGTNPFMNITDSFDNGIPAFGPIDIPVNSK